MLKDIAKHYVSKLIPSSSYNSANPVKDESLLFPLFLRLVNDAIQLFNRKYSDVKVVFVETYRSNTLQLIHFNNGASKIRKDGMHHFAIAVDCFFNVNGKNTYNGDYKFLRECFVQCGLNLLGVWDMGHVQMIRVADQQVVRNAVKQAVKDFQRENGLTSDGIVGKKTIAKAKEVYGV